MFSFKFYLILKYPHSITQQIFEVLTCISLASSTYKDCLPALVKYGKKKKNEGLVKYN